MITDAGGADNRAGRWDDGLKPRERKFVVYYCTDDDCFMNGRKAFRKANTKYRAGEVTYEPSDSVSDTGASKLLSSAKVKSAVRRLLAELQPDVDAENIPRLLHDLYVQATFSPADIVDASGRLVVDDIAELGDKAKCIRQLYATKYGTRVELADRSRAQEKLLRYYDLVRERLPDADGDGMARVVLASQSASVDDWNRENGDGDAVEATA